MKITNGPADAEDGLLDSRYRLYITWVMKPDDILIEKTYVLFSLVYI